MIQLLTYINDLETKNIRLTRKTAQVFQIIVHLVDFNVLEFCQAVNIPVDIAYVVFTLCILEQVDLFLDLQGVSIWDNDYLTELADDMTGIGIVNRWIIFHLLVKTEVSMSVAYEKWPDWF